MIPAKDKETTTGLTFIKLTPNESLSDYFPRQQPIDVAIIKSLCQTIRLSDIEESPLNK